MQVTRTSATIHGTVNAHGNPTTAGFLFIGGSFYNAFDATLTPNNGTTAVPISFTVTGLDPGTTYSYRAFASNPDSGPFFSGFEFTDMVSFTTPSTSLELFRMTVSAAP